MSCDEEPKYPTHTKEELEKAIAEFNAHQRAIQYTDVEHIGSNRALRRAVKKIRRAVNK